MQALMTVVLLLQVLSALAMIGLVLVQHGKGADMGASFGSGASGSLFGATGSANFLSRSTAVAATVFFASTLGLAYFGNNRGAATAEQPSLLEQAASAAAAASAGAVPASAVLPAASGAALIPTK
ncbi:protein translocase subunit secG [Aquabacterium commune]|jgi:preprotein translocase subunit SecG|uniref:Protein-export membrane protein SecG n=1 Tax=Aquabacterium commune TaxID=70586 RepID=A0A4R6RC65_9BURK|nr:MULTISPECIES: preprotein translocase subunit SecG [Aquabacterium]MBT9611011.1 preprotein translocase subunit SecG [Aquabacterium sp.]TDP83740.1 protein translocase subunit secG [Aquabacterium commune]